MAEITAFLARHGWGTAERRPLAGDASARRYERIRHGGQSAVLMIAPPGAEFARFLSVDAWLLAQGFSAPQILAAAPETGLMLLEDFGDAVLARLLTLQPENQPAFYAAITDFLIALHACPVPDFLAPLDGPALAELVGLVPAWYPLADLAAGAELVPLIASLWAETEPFAPVMCLRDFHAENVIWLPGRAGSARLGLLDFQDAVVAAPAYDLVSALQDARRDVPAAIEARERARYVALRGFDPVQFEASYALLGAQRALRILAIFARLCLAGGKPQYLALIPRVWGYLRRNLGAPGLAPLRRVVDAALLPPTPDLLARMERECGQHLMR
ncbi:aminoglycoside phosphotransferase family protein [Rhodobacter maris]|uniref:Aminoglycoside phosphotransferase domain-containing protein n=1 Tax=Rhodobacter maris TaxID=446682 RepID=A0A285SG23_9RHOB|nr:phosphotransferase [Rhodobacter maris]SOC06625.1 hypothetical protein SAMN05877831_10568 [Rhodobacter maris]